MSTSTDFMRMMIASADESVRKSLLCTTTKSDVFLREQRKVEGHVALHVSVRTQKFGASLAVVFNEQTMHDTCLALRSDKDHVLGSLAKECSASMQNSLMRAGIPVGQVYVATRAYQYSDMPHSEAGPCVVAQYRTQHGPLHLEAIVTDAKKSS